MAQKQQRRMQEFSQHQKETPERNPLTHHIVAFKKENTENTLLNPKHILYFTLQFDFYTATPEGGSGRFTEEP